MVGEIRRAPSAIIGTAALLLLPELRSRRGVLLVPLLLHAAWLLCIVWCIAYYEEEEEEEEQEA